MKYIKGCDNLNVLDQNEVGFWVVMLIAKDRLEDFYNSKYWRRLRKEVLAHHKGECQKCKEHGFYTEANTVHHVQHVRKHPRLALSKTYIYHCIEYKNLIPLCHNCHEGVHGYRKKEDVKPLTEERW